MLNLVWFLICKEIIIDQTTNLVSYINCLEGIIVPKIPVDLFTISFGSLWTKNTKDPISFKVRILMKAPSGYSKIIFTTEDIRFEKDRQRVNIMINGQKIEEAGIYIFQLEHYFDSKWQLAAELPFYCILKEAQ